MPIWQNFCKFVVSKTNYKHFHTHEQRYKFNFRNRQIFQRKWCHQCNEQNYEDNTYVELLGEKALRSGKQMQWQRISDLSVRAWDLSPLKNSWKCGRDAERTEGHQLYARQCLISNSSYSWQISKLETAIRHKEVNI